MKCPVCNQDFELSEKDIQVDFYYDCDHCHSSLFFKEGKCEVLSEGSLKREGEEEVVSESQDEELVSESQEEAEPLEVTEVPELSISEESLDSSSNSEPQEESPDPFVPEENLEEDVLSDQASEEPQEQELEEQIEEPEKESEENLETREADQSLENFSEVTEYGNQHSLGEEGVFYYDLILSEINSKEVHKELERILEDEALKIDPEKNRLLIEDGVLKISEISPVKVHIIVKALIGLPIKIFWKQHLIMDKT